MKKRFHLIALWSAGAVCFASVLIHPFGPMKTETSQAPLLTDAPVESSVMAIFTRSCQNCHSEKTDWPWYSYVAPMSWMIEKDVQQGRSHMNLSRWYEYSDEQKQQILSRMASLVRNRQMPLPRYLLLHPEAKLSDAEVDQLYQSARKERKRLKSKEAPAEVTSSTGGN
jgi:Haem-binding domain